MYRLQAGAFQCSHDLHIRGCFIFLFVLFESAEKSSVAPKDVYRPSIFFFSHPYSLALAVMNKSSAVDILTRALDGLSRENSGSVNRLDWSVKIICNNYHSKSKKEVLNYNNAYKFVDWPTLTFYTLSSLFNIKALFTLDALSSFSSLGIKSRNTSLGSTQYKDYSRQRSPSLHMYARIVEISRLESILAR